MFTAKSPDDDFLLQLIAFLDEMSESDEMDLALFQAEAFRGLDPDKSAQYHRRALDVCRDLDIEVEQGQRPSDVSRLRLVEYPSLPGPKHDSHATDHEALRRDESPIPSATRTAIRESSTPPRIAAGMRLAPTAQYLNEVAEPSRVGRNPRPLIVFDIDGTLLRRPPHILEHQVDSGSEPVGRP